MFLFSSLTLDIGLIMTICLYIFMVGQDIKKLKNKGKIYLNSNREINEYIFVPILMTLSFYMMFITRNEDIFQKVICIILGVTIEVIGAIAVLVNKAYVNMLLLRIRPFIQRTIMLDINGVR